MWTPAPLGRHQLFSAPSSTGNLPTYSSVLKWELTALFVMESAQSHSPSYQIFPGPWNEGESPRPNMRDQETAWMWSPGGSLANHESISPTEADRYKFVDDISCLEIINLLSFGLASHNVRLQLPSDVPSHGQIINSECEYLKTQEYLNEISRWTSKLIFF